MGTTPPSSRSVLQLLSKDRLLALGRVFAVDLRSSHNKEQLVDSLIVSGKVHLDGVLRALHRDELRDALRHHGHDEHGRSRDELVQRLLGGRHGPSAPPAEVPARESSLPARGDVVHVRHRQYLVESVEPRQPTDLARTLVRLVCLDDDAQGRKLDVLWELELGARILRQDVTSLGRSGQLDPARAFAAYLHALRWNCVTATDAQLFQAPFRAGIKILNHQLTPLKKALELPRANLFIADDVGLGKTIEAGLVLQELLLRQRVELALIVCPASVTLQWQSEMEKRFGLPFVIYGREFVTRRRQERGFGINPWTTHARFIVSYQTLRRPEHRDPLLALLGERAKKSLLILDEAHIAAPSSASRYAVDSRITHVVRDIAPRFENRLFLSATPHNGHSNSFSSLLEILDPQRFTRGVPVLGPAQLDKVMVRRLKGDLRATGESFPERHIVQIDLRHDQGQWVMSVEGDPNCPSSLPLGDQDDAELELAKLLAAYTRALGTSTKAAKLVVMTLQKRLLSSVEAFFRTLQAHANSDATKARLGVVSDATFARNSAFDDEDDDVDLDDEAREEALASHVEAASAAVRASDAAPPSDLLSKMLSIASRLRSRADAKVLALLAWIRLFVCPGARLGGAKRQAKEKTWGPRRILVFTEYGDTRRYLMNVLAEAIDGTDLAEERIRSIHGGMSEEERAEVQRAFNDPDDPVRILIATDAAREGVNLQGQCADLFHFDVPWNPARMEQRNGRIDRTLQPSTHVRCHYFFFPQRPEDLVLRVLVSKVETIQNELGSLGSVVLERMGAALENGISSDTLDHIKQADVVDAQQRHTVIHELESVRVEDDSATEAPSKKPEIAQAQDKIHQQARAKIRRETTEAGRIFNRSRDVLGFAPELLRDALDIGLQLIGAAPLEPVKAKDGAKSVEAFMLPTLPHGWEVTLDTVRPARRKDEPWYEWRKRPLLPLVFEPPSRLDAQLAHMHLQHPLVQRLLAPFLAQGFTAHGLNRVSVLRNRGDSLVRVVAFGRLSLFGAGATRLHDEVVAVAAQWLDDKGPGHLEPGADRDDEHMRRRLDELLASKHGLGEVPDQVRAMLAQSAPGDFSTLWKHVQAEAQTRAYDAKQKLSLRGKDEAAALSKILNQQRVNIDRILREREQTTLVFDAVEAQQKKQLEEDLRHMKQRLVAIEREIQTEPESLEALYQVELERITPVGLVYLWPETR